MGEVLLISYFHRSDIEQVKVSCKGSIFGTIVYIYKNSGKSSCTSESFIGMISQVITISTGKTKTIVYT